MNCQGKKKEEGKYEVGILLKSLYGTRDASANFQAEVAMLMISMRFNKEPIQPKHMLP